MVTKEFKNVVSLLTCLDTAKEENNGWYFRGQPDAQFELLPSVWRVDHNTIFKEFCDQMNNEDELRSQIQREYDNFKYKDNLKMTDIIEWLKKVKFENYLLSRFYGMINKSGLPISERQMHLYSTYPPTSWLTGGSNDWMNLRQRFDFYVSHKENGDKRFDSPIIFEASLPQHHGLLTRLMDWTSNPRKAIFFAAYNYLKMNGKSNQIKDIAIYAIKETKDAVGIRNEHIRYKNTFLHVQDGVFTETHGDFYFWENGKWPTIEELYSTIPGGDQDLQKFTIPAEHSKILLDRLERCGISIAEMMPDYRHIAEDILMK